VSLRHSLVRKGDSQRLPGFPHGQTVTAPRLKWSEYAYASGSKGRGSHAMGDSCESARPIFSPDKSVCSARVGGAFASTSPDCQEASRRKRPGYVIVNESPRSHLSRWWAKPSLAGGRPASVRLGTAGVPDSQRRGQGLGDDCGNPSARMPSAGSVPGRRWARASDLQIRLFSWGVGGRFLVFHVKLFSKNGLFQSGLLQEFEDKCRKTVCAAISRWPQRC